ncbi:hypothetical protein BASA81_002046 [Batrachochytrium salamandrivorans]|nr:hypothetical protein BASA81_002046 [Batrachochytrium salamandrivorans]
MGSSSDEEEENSSSSSEEEQVQRRSTRRAAPRRSFKEESTASEEEEDDDNDEDSEDSEDSKPRKRTSSASSSRKKKSPAATKRKTATPPAKKRAKLAMGEKEKKKPKQITHMKQMEMAMKSQKWWEADPLPEGIRWRNLEHNGVIFPPAYEPHGQPLVYAGKEIQLSPEAEELATYYAACLGSQNLEKESSAKTFNDNFFSQFQGVVDCMVVKEFIHCDFTRIRAHLDLERERKKELPKEVKELKKQQDEELKLKYTFAIVDGSLMKVGNCMIEPPGLFRGRGAHPKAGLLKPRIQPENVTLNIGENAPVPPCPIPGRSWGKIVHNHTTTWLANWKDMSGANKYVYLGASSHFKGETDREKYEKARRLKRMIPQIRANYMRGMQDKEGTTQQMQIATAVWIIDRLALRVGGEKEEDEADTVGTCSLRVEHIRLEEPTQITLDFLGKDSMRHFETYNLADEHYEGSGLVAFRCLKQFVQGKDPGQQIFDSVVPAILNDHLKNIMPGLTAKVFRTYNASFTLEKELPREMPSMATLEEKEMAYNDANRKVAILCNHQKSVSKATELGVEKKQSEIADLESQLIDLNKWLKKGKAPIRKDDLSVEEKRKQAHMFTSEPSSDQIEKRIGMWEKRLEMLKHRASEQDKNKSVALSTSKINYMDPRISVAWAKRNEFPIEKIYSATQREKFPWAMSETVGFEF